MAGLVGPMPSGPGIIAPETCREISRAAAGAWDASPVLLSSSESEEAIRRIVLNAQVDAVQLVRHVDPGVHRALEESLPGVWRIQVIHVEDASALDLLHVYGNAPDAFLLDSGAPSKGLLGGTGTPHDWRVSGEFVRRTALPTWACGGTGPAQRGQRHRMRSTRWTGRVLGRAHSRRSIGPTEVARIHARGAHGPSTSTLQVRHRGWTETNVEVFIKTERVRDE